MSIDLANVRRQLAERREAHVNHGEGCECSEKLNHLLLHWDDARDVFELWLYAQKEGDVETTRECAKLLAAFAMTTVQLLAEGEAHALKARAELWVAEAGARDQGAA